MLRTILLEAREAATQPRDFFARAAERESWTAPAARLAVWSEAAALVEIALNWATGQRAPGDSVVDVLLLALFPLFGLAAGLAAALVLHGTWRLLGGRARPAASWRAVGAASFMMPLITLAQPLGPAGLAVWLWLYALLAYAGRGVHGLGAARAWLVSGALAALHVAAVLLR